MLFGMKCWVVAVIVLVVGVMGSAFVLVWIVIVMLLIGFYVLVLIWIVDICSGFGGSAELLVLGVERRIAVASRLLVLVDVICVVAWLFVVDVVVFGELRVYLCGAYDLNGLGLIDVELDAVIALDLVMLIVGAFCVIFIVLMHFGVMVLNLVMVGMGGDWYVCFYMSGLVYLLVDLVVWYVLLFKVGYIGKVL